MNEIQIKLTITADKAVVKLVESIVPIVEKITAAYKEAQGKPAEAPKAPEAENTPSEPEKPASAPQSAEEDDPGFKDMLPTAEEDAAVGPGAAPITAADCIKEARLAMQQRGVKAEAIRATVASFGASRPQDVPEDKIPELYRALRSLK